MKMSWSALVVMVILAVSMIGGQVATAQDCGAQARGKLCSGGNCCSQWGYCGKTPQHCGTGCQSQCSRVAGAKLAGDGYGGLNSNKTTTTTTTAAQP